MRIRFSFACMMVVLSAGRAFAGDWHSVGGSGFPEASPKAPNVMAFSGVQPEMAEIVAASGDCKLLRREEDKVIRDVVRVGDNVLAGDSIETGPDSSVEIVLGINNRLVIGPKSSLQFAGMSTAKEGDAVATRRAVFLARGTVRARVRRNTITPSPLVITLDKSRVEVGSNKLNVPGGVDVVLTPGADEEGSRVSVLHGSAEITQLKASGSGPAKVIVPEGVVAPGESSLPIAGGSLGTTGDAGGTQPETNRKPGQLPPGVKILSAVEKARLQEILPFSNDQPESQPVSEETEY